MRNFQDVCEWVKRETGQAVRPYSTYDFGRSKDYSHRSVILSQTNAAQLIQKAMPSLPEGVLMFTGTSGTRLGDGRREEDVEVVIGRGKDQWDKLRIARTIDCNRDWTAIGALYICYRSYWRHRRFVHPPERVQSSTPAVSSPTDGTATTAFAAFSLMVGWWAVFLSAHQIRKTAVIALSATIPWACSGTSRLCGTDRFQGGFRQPDFMMPALSRYRPIGTRFHRYHLPRLLATLVFPIRFPFWQDIDHPEAWDLRFSLRIHSTHVHANPLHVLLPHRFNRRQQVVENHIAGACPPSTTGFQDVEIPFRVFRGSAGGRPGPVLVWEEEVQSQPIVRLSAHVSYSYFHFTLADHVFE